MDNPRQSLIVFLILFGLFGLVFWMAPHAHEWESCGYSASASWGRAVFGGPSTLECLSGVVQPSTGD